MLAEVISTSHGQTKRVSAKYVTDKLTKDEAKKILPELINNVRKNNHVVNVYLYENTKQKRYENAYCRAQWSRADAVHVPNITEDEIINGNVYVKWVSYHDALKEIIDKEENT